MTVANNQIDKRLLYFTGQFLQEPDFTDEQNYHVDRLQRHTMYLHTPGIASGLSVTGADRGATKITIEKGVAIDGSGQAIYLDQNRENIPLDAPENKGQTVLVVISYDEEQQKVTIKNLEPLEANRIAEVPKIEIIPEAQNPPSKTHIRLTRLRLDAEGKIDQFEDGAKLQDDSVRVYAGSRLPSEVALTKLSLSRPEDVQDWPELTSSARGVVDLQGNLKVSGKINNRDVAADGNKLDTHLGAMGNPHRTTAADIDSQGGTNQLVARINASSGVISEARIDPAIARDSEVKAYFDVNNGHNHDGSNSRKLNHTSLNLDGGTNPHRTTATDIDSQGGTNQIVARINASSGVISEARIDPAIARDSELTEKLNGMFVAGTITIEPTGASSLVQVTRQDMLDRVVSIRGWASTTEGGAPGILRGRSGIWPSLPEGYQEGWVYAARADVGISPTMFTFGSGATSVSLILSVGQTGIFYRFRGTAQTVVGHAFQITWQ